MKSLHAALDVKAYEDTCRQMLTMMMAEVSDAFERLPCLIDADILRNIIYAGVWTKYNKILSERYESESNAGKIDKMIQDAANQMK